MKDGHVLDQLSAYLDGQAKNPERIERHLQQCASCARRHMQLAKLDAHLKAFEGPSVQPAFLTRVMARIKDEPVSQSAWPLGRLMPVASVALVLALVLGAYLYWPAGEDISGGPEFASADDLVEELERRIADGQDIDLLGVEEELTVGQLASASYYEPELDDDYSELLIESEWFGTFASEVEANADLDELILGMDETEIEEFKSLIFEYATQEWKT